VDFADFLAETLLFLRAAVDEVTIVTSPSDRRTAGVARHFGARIVRTTAMYDEGRRFSLGAAIDAGLDRTLNYLTDWVLVIDADIFLPRATGATLRGLELDPTALYGIDCARCRGWKAWDRFRRTARKVRSTTVNTYGFPIADRISDPALSGYTPRGFFQLWNPLCSGVDTYPIHPAGTARGSDILHAARWPRCHRHLIPEIIAIQLETEPPSGAAVGVNWAGRRTPEFSREGGPYRRVA